MLGTPIAEPFRLLQAGDAAGALASARRLIEQHPGSARAHLAAGLALRALGRQQESLAELEAALRLDPADFAAAYESGLALQALGSADAVARFEQATALRPDFAPAHYALGMHAFAASDWGNAARHLRRAAALDPANPAASTNLGLALAEAGELEGALATLEATVARFAGFAPARHALGWTLHKARRARDAIEHLQAAVAATPDWRWRLDLAKALADAGQDAEAGEEFERLLATDGGELEVLVNHGRHDVRLGNYARAAQLFRTAWEAAPTDRELAMYVAQVELLRGKWRDGWHAYAQREPRRRFEAARSRAGVPYRPPTRADVQGRHVLVVGEQGLGDELFFLRFAPALLALGASVSYAGDARLAPLLRRAGLFAGVLASADPWPEDALPILSGDLPPLVDECVLPPTLRVAPLAERVEAMRSRLQRAGPRPWIGVTWRAGTPQEVIADGLLKSVPVAQLFAALPRVGTVVSLQRDGHFEELESASRALARPIHDFSNANADLEDALALVSLLDRHIGVSNTNMHLAAAAGATAAVLVPFPPEWRWGASGDASPWFPGFRVYRQEPRGDWSRALAAMANAPGGNASRG